MSCFWDALRTKIPFFRDHKFTADQVKCYLKKYNRETVHVARRTPDSPLKPYRTKQLEEHHEWRAEYAGPQPSTEADLSGNWKGHAGGGHETSADDPFLALCTELFGVHIVHTIGSGRYHGTTVEYLPLTPTTTKIQFRSSPGHFS